MTNRGRRDVLKLVGSGFVASASAIVPGAMKAAEAQEHGAASGASGLPFYNVRSFGALGDGRTIDSPAINRAIDAANGSGGGTVHLPAGDYLCYSIRLKDRVALYLDAGAVIVAADPLPSGQTGGYDDPEPVQAWEDYQDYGHNHWHNSLIWGEGLRDISIVGSGRIHGKGLARDNGPASNNEASRRVLGVGNKSISLKNCCNVLLKDFQILQGGWFGILATGVDNLTIDSLTIDTNRDGIDIDCCRNVRVSNCTINSPWDDALVPKSSYALGYPRATENVTISNCFVTGAYVMGTLLDGTWRKWPADAGVPRIGRIKFGTESNGGFKNIVITNCIFEGCQGLAFESEDGALLEDITVSNLTMRDIASAPIFMRLGSRLRGQAGQTKVGAVRRIYLNNIICSSSTSRWGSIISGIPGFPIENVHISQVYIQHEGGGTKEMAGLQPPENEQMYPDPNMFGPIPSQGFFLRHVRHIELTNVRIVAGAGDQRPSFVLEDVADADFYHIETQEAVGVPKFVLRGVTNFSIQRTKGIKDVEIAKVDRVSL